MNTKSLITTLLATTIVLAACSSAAPTSQPDGSQPETGNPTSTLGYTATKSGPIATWDINSPLGTNTYTPFPSRTPEPSETPDRRPTSTDYPTSTAVYSLDTHLTWGMQGMYGAIISRDQGTTIFSDENFKNIVQTMSNIYTAGTRNGYFDESAFGPLTEMIKNIVGDSPYNRGSNISRVYVVEDTDLAYQLDSIIGNEDLRKYISNGVVHEGQVTLTYGWGTDSQREVTLHDDSIAKVNAAVLRKGDLYDKAKGYVADNNEFACFADNLFSCAFGFDSPVIMLVETSNLDEAGYGSYLAVRMERKPVQ